MSSFKEKVQGWIQSGVFSTEFGVDDLTIIAKESTERVIIADNGEHYIVVEDGLSSDEALGRLTTMLPFRSCVWIAANFKPEHRNALKWLEENVKVWITTGRHDVLFDEGPKREEHDQQA